MESLSRENLEALLESLESAISELQSRNEPRLAGAIARLERRRAEIVAALASQGRPDS
jgi:ABC-type lipopolysaccharide export system ATPase subunit